MGLALADSKYFRATTRTDALGRRLAVLHGDAFGILYFLLGTALNAISLHIQSLLYCFALTLNHTTRPSQAISCFLEAKREG